MTCPLFDAYAVRLGRDVEQLLPKVRKRQVFHPQVCISAVVLADGCIEGTWEHQIRGSQAVVKVHIFSPPARSVVKGIEAEAERLGAFLNSKVALDAMRNEH